MLIKCHGQLTFPYLALQLCIIPIKYHIPQMKAQVIAMPLHVKGYFHTLSTTDRVLRQVNSSSPEPHPDSAFSRTTSNIKHLSQGLLFLGFYLFIFREKGKEGEREGEKHQCVRKYQLVTFLSAPQPRTKLGNPSSNLSLSRTIPNQLSHTHQGSASIF